MKKVLLFLSLLIICSTQLYGIIRNVPNDHDTIQGAIDASVNGDTVLVEQNTYFENINYSGKNIVVGSLFLITNDENIISETIIDGSANGSVVTIRSNEDSTAMLIGFTIRNGKSNSGGGVYVNFASPAIYNCIITQNTIEASNPIGGGIYLRNSRSVVYGCEVMHNTATGKDNSNGWGGGISLIACTSAKIINCKIHHNQTTSGYGGMGVSGSVAKVIGCEITNNFCYSSSSGMGCQDSDLELINCTIANNKSTTSDFGFYFIRSSPVIRNSIIWHNLRNSGNYGIHGWGGTPEIYYSNIQNGYDTLSVMNLEPMFADTAAADFRLQAGSPCIDAGDPDTACLDLPIYDLNGILRFQDGDSDGTSRVDMGAHEYPSPPERVADKENLNKPNSVHLMQNYPNPFNATTEICYDLPDAAHVSLAIYNLMGIEQRLLINEHKTAGHHIAHWDGKDKHGRTLPSGIYLYRLKSGEFNDIKKLILLK